MQRRPEIHLFAARYREQLGDIEGASSSYRVLRNDLEPGLLEAVIKQVNFEKRQYNSMAVCSVFDSALEDFEKDTRALAVLYIQYARFLDQVNIHLLLIFYVSFKYVKSRKVSRKILNSSLRAALLLRLIVDQYFIISLTVRFLEGDGTPRGGAESVPYSFG